MVSVGFSAVAAAEFVADTFAIFKNKSQNSKMLDYDGEDTQPLVSTSVTDETDKWDDSFLISMWDSEIETYRKFHKEHDLETLHPNQREFPKWQPVVETVVLDEVVQNSLEERKRELKEKQASIAKEVARPTEEPKVAMTKEARRYTPYPKPKQQITKETVQIQEKDDTFQKMLWAWYNAGYQTGFHQAKQDLL